VGTRLCALPLEQVNETMRPMPLEPWPGAPAGVVGVSIIRGAPVPVVDASALLGGRSTRPGRFVTLRVDGRVVALAVDAVLGVRAIARESMSDLPPLLRDAHRDGVSSIGALDAQLVVILEAARILPDTRASGFEEDPA
jgi:purine-binding chemotaxis protein CheW